jgi:hypothetical protein
MTLEELKKLISKDETKNIELRFNPWVYGNDPYTNEPQNEHQNEPTLGKGRRKMAIGFEKSGLDRRQTKDYI